jgi:ABC-type lipoprotein export system ATPase subunit
MHGNETTGTLVRMPLAELLVREPRIGEFFASLGLAPPLAETTTEAHFHALSGETLEDLGIEREELFERFFAFLDLLARLDSTTRASRIISLTVRGGHDKSGCAEDLDLTIKTGEVVAVVGPTGSGKSRLLSDIEWMAQGDTPTGRVILLNGTKPDPRLRFSIEHKLVAQLSQNMNFVVDLTVEEFIRMHAESRHCAAVVESTRTVIAMANALAGERFAPDVAVTALSGGQSRALMIADTACLSASPIVLIDEIENAGIDRRRAVKTLVGQGKIVFMATHDPLLALMADRRLVFRNGGICANVTTSAREREILSEFETMDARIASAREALRRGELLHENR